VGPRVGLDFYVKKNFEIWFLDRPGYLLRKTQRNIVLKNKIVVSYE